MKYLGDSYSIRLMKERGVDTSEIQLVDSYFTPTEKDLEKLADIIFQNNCSSVLDVGCGNGSFLISLVREMRSNIGLRSKSSIHFKGIDTRFYDEPAPEHFHFNLLDFEFIGIEAYAQLLESKGMTKTICSSNSGVKTSPPIKHDCVICVWMPQGSDWREMLCKASNKLVILILSRDFNTGTIESYLGCEQFGFKFLKKWVSQNNVIQVWSKEGV